MKELIVKSIVWIIIIWSILIYHSYTLDKALSAFPEAEQAKIHTGVTVDPEEKTFNVRTSIYIFKEHEKTIQTLRKIGRLVKKNRIALN